MKQMNKLAAAVAMALGMGMVSQANAIELKTNGVGDTLLFPAFNGYVDNYFTIHNTSGYWVQGHLRFRGASWTSELLDFDVILSPGDVFLFRLADLDGDGQWEIDMSLDPKNFQYTAIAATGCNGTCLDGSYALEPENCPSLTNNKVKDVNPLLIEHQRHVGYVEFIGEATLNGMTKARMDALLKSGSDLSKVGLSEANRTKVSNGLGTNAWVWSDAENNFAEDRGLTGFGNVVMGSAFVGIPGSTTRLAYNAEAFVDFRTIYNNHRIDNYSRRNGSNYGGNGTPDFELPSTVYIGNAANNTAVVVATQEVVSIAQVDREVILHHENAGIPDGDYVYRYPDTREDEMRVSFNNTWGPTLADGDDWFVDNNGDGVFSGEAGNYPMLNAVTDYWDNRLSAPNSIAEVEQAIRAGGQTFESYYFDGGSLGGAQLGSWYFAHFPTKYYYAEDEDYYGVPQTNTGFSQYLCYAVDDALKLGREMKVEVWDIFENTQKPAGGDNISPVLAKVEKAVLGEELTFFGIRDFFKKAYGGLVDGYTSGRVVLAPVENNPVPNPEAAIPFMAYTFEAGYDGTLGQWRSMHRH